MPVALATPPPGLLYRVAHAPDPLAWPDRQFIGDSRFDDPLNRFRVLYLAEQRLGCFVESLARFRPDIELLALLTSVAGATEPLPAPVVPVDWYVRRRVGSLRLLPGQRWLDLRAAETLQALRSELASALISLGLSDFDVNTARGPSRDLTRQIAHWAYEHGFQGIGYRSRFADHLDCWAVFEGAALAPAGSVDAIGPDDPDLSAAAELVGLTIES